MAVSEINRLEDQILENQTGGGGRELSDAVLFAVIGIAAFFKLDMLPWLGFLFAAIACLILGAMFWRRKIIYPRVGYAKMRQESALYKVFRPQRRFVILQMMTFLVLIAIVCIVKLYLPPQTSSDSASSDGSYAFTFWIFMLSASAGARQWRNILLIAAWATAVLLTSTLWHVNILYAIAISFSVALIFGLRKLRRFLKENPVLEGDPADDLSR
ncbi:MAG TPA: hypothetical protein VGL38_11585 [bacterium]|jgi:hypothetical protein